MSFDPDGSWERQATIWLNSEPLFRSIVRSKAWGHQGSDQNLQAQWI
jgi:hypothetical protein